MEPCASSMQAKAWSLLGLIRELDQDFATPDLVAARLLCLYPRPQQHFTTINLVRARARTKSLTAHMRKAGLAALHQGSNGSTSEHCIHLYPPRCCWSRQPPRPREPVRSQQDRHFAKPSTKMAHPE